MSADSSINQDITYEYQDQWKAPGSQRLKRQEEHNEESKYGGWNEDNFAAARPSIQLSKTKSHKPYCSYHDNCRPFSKYGQVLPWMNNAKVPVDRHERLCL